VNFNISSFTEKIIHVLCVVLVVTIACTRIVQPQKQLGKVFPHKFHRGLWVRAVSIASPDSIPRIFDVAEDLGITDIYVQVVVAGYAYYKSNILPRSQYLSEISGSVYDPLDAFINVAKNRGIHVHAWVNALLVWSLNKPPDSADHIFYKHPKWFIKDVNRKSMVDYTHEEWTDLGLEGLYLDPAHKEVQAHLKNVCAEIVNNYQVKGIHLDFIRYPGILWGLPDNDTSAVFAGLEGQKVRWFNLLRYPQLSLFLRWIVWHVWRLNKQKEKTITQLVKEIRAAITPNAINSESILSAAIFANPGLARYRFAQNWTAWGASLDYPIAMSYTENIDYFSDFLNSCLTYRPDAIFGIGFLWPDMEAEAYWQVQAVRQAYGAGICFFDFTSVDTMVDFEKLKGHIVINKDSLMHDTKVLAKIESVFTDVAQPSFVEKGKQMLPPDGNLEFLEFLLHSSMNPDEDLIRMDMNRDELTRKIQDDVAAFEFLNSVAFSITDELIEPPKREVHYEFLPWDEEDSTVIIEKAEAIENLTQQTVVYPTAMNNLACAAFQAEKGVKSTRLVRTGVYIFEVKNIYEGGKTVKRNSVDKKLLPIYINWTIKKKFQQMTNSR